MNVTRKNTGRFILALLLLSALSVAAQKSLGYNVKRSAPAHIDANWNKREWKKIKPINIKNFMDAVPAFKPVVQAKISYDKNNVYVIFKVVDRYVRCLTDTINGPVWEDACVEFFFAPDDSFPLKYFNLEINCGGIALMNYNAVAKNSVTIINPEDIKKIEIAHSLQKKITEEIKDTIIWTVEYKLPIAILEKYAFVTRPKRRTVWKANFYKIAHRSSNPHYITWSPVNYKEVDFHTPEFFGTLKFD